MRYCADPANYLVSRSSTTTTASKTLQELIQLERTHEASFRAWNQGSLAANQAINSWALADSADDRIIEVLNQVSRLLSQSVKAQNRYAIALADYRGCLKEIMIRESELRMVKREREILLKRLLKLNKQSAISNPSNSLNLNIKLDDAKRELSICQKTLKTASDALFNAKQYALREALRLKLTRFEQLGQTIKLNAAQAIQLLAQLDSAESDLSTADDESDFESCDEDPTLDDSNNNPKTDSKIDQQPTPKPTHPPTPTQAQQPAVDQPIYQAVTPTSPRLQKAALKPNQSRGINGGAVKRAPVKIPVKRRGPPRFKKRKSNLALSSQAKRTAPSPPLTDRASQPVPQPEPRPRHVRQRSQSLNLEVSLIPQHHRNTTRPAQHVRQGSLGLPYPLSVNGSSHANFGSLPLSSAHKTRDSLSSFKLFSKGMLSKFGVKGKQKEEVRPPNRSQWSHQTHPQPASGPAEAIRARREVSLWPTIEPLSLYPDSEDSGSDDCSSSQGDDELETAEVADRVPGLGRPVEAGPSSEGGPSRLALPRSSWGTPTTYPGARRRSRPVSHMKGRAESDVEGSSGSEGLDTRQLTDYLPAEELAVRRRRQREHRKAIEALTRNLGHIQPGRSTTSANHPAGLQNTYASRDPRVIDRLSDKENLPADPDHLIQYDSDFDLSDQNVEHHPHHEHDHQDMPLTDELHHQHQQLQQIQQRLLLQRQQVDE